MNILGLIEITSTVIRESKGGIIASVGVGREGGNIQVFAEVGRWSAPLAKDVQEVHQKRYQHLPQREESERILELEDAAELLHLEEDDGDRKKNKK